MIINDELSQAYYNWLAYDILQSRPNWFPVLKVLHSRDYLPILIMDDSRAKDGINLRDIYMSHINGSYAIVQGSNPWGDIPCSMLEMMVALAMRMKEEFYSEYDDIFDMLTIIFASMLSSLGINVDTITEDELNQKIDIFMCRQYEPTGRGSLFNLTGKTFDIDWRDPPIWNQMLAWVSTKHILEEE